MPEWSVSKRYGLDLALGLMRNLRIDALKEEKADLGMPNNQCDSEVRQEVGILLKVWLGSERSWKKGDKATSIW